MGNRGHSSDWNDLNRLIIDCEQCPRLREHCQRVAREKRAAYRDWEYWGRPVPNFGDPRGRMLIVSLAPAAHGANRTGRMFTGDRSGLWLFRALHKAGFANQAESTDANDGLQLLDCAITAAAHCAPPVNKPSPEELAACGEWFERTIDGMPVAVFLALGQIAWRAIVLEARRRGWHSGKIPKFGHAAQIELANRRWLLGSYHPSQQNTHTGRLTEPMFDQVFRAARLLLESG
jgi:uracil-DNA glycosylase family 4